MPFRKQLIQIERSACASRAEPGLPSQKHENPYVYADGYEAHQRCRKYVDRSLHDPVVIHAGGKVVRAFASVGWGWGRTWQGARDYQHFSANGR